MTSLSLSMALILTASVACACARQDPKLVVSPPAAAVAPAPAVPKDVVKAQAAKKPGSRTLFERYENRHKCQSNPAMCDGDFFEMDIKKSLEKELDPDSNLSTQFCVGGCAKKSVLQWSLEWQ